MRLLNTIFTFLLIASAYSLAQTDSLIIRLKSNQVEKIAISQIKNIRFENITAVNEAQSANINLKSGTNYPNPFSEQTSIEFEIANPGNVGVIIYDNSGNQIQSLICENCSTGKNTLKWDGMDKNHNRVQSGTYFYEVHYGKEILSKKMIVIK
ncbi:MAG: T9SS type A sorting domain-containing protein [Candidatus Kapabacteria bacterium]|nr:T9SS type A sorting domain-containing protein [Candidatus Kapabacteria bacterium]